MKNHLRLQRTPSIEPLRSVQENDGWRNSSAYPGLVYRSRPVVDCARGGETLWRVEVVSTYWQRIRIALGSPDRPECTHLTVEPGCKATMYSLCTAPVPDLAFRGAWIRGRQNAPLRPVA